MEPEKLNINDNENDLSEALPVEDESAEEVTEVAEVAEVVEDAELAEEIKEVQAEFAESEKVFNEHVDELKELQNEEGLPEKAKNILMAGVREIKDYVQANPYFNILAATQLAGGVGLGIRELAGGGDWKEVVGGVVASVVGWGIAKAVAYLGWGRRAIKEEAAEAEAEKEVGKRLVARKVEAREGEEIEEVAEALPVEEAEEVPIETEEGKQEQIEKLKESLEDKYKEDNAQ